jgi:hypothetical protein
LKLRSEKRASARDSVAARVAGTTRSIDREEAKKAIVDAVSTVSLRRPDIYEAVIPEFFMHYKNKDYRAMIDQLTFEEGRLDPDRRMMKRRNQLNDDTPLSAKSSFGLK